jgi:hypothetical protein
MITEVTTSKGTDAITSDHWHVVHSRLTNANSKRPFSRLITSEHDDRTACCEAAQALRVKLREETPRVPLAERDQVFACRPGFKSLKLARSRRAKAK